MDDFRPQISWRDGVPESKTFGDIYYSKDDGVEESRYVFVEGNGLEQRFSELDDDTSTFTLVETGFGTGLNFLVTLEVWLESRPLCASLEYVSVEKYPLTPSDFKKALQSWPQFEALSTPIIDAYPSSQRGNYRIFFPSWNVHLTLLFGDCVESLAQIDFCAHAWLLDGFAPSKNPDMWSIELFQLITKRSKPNATFATFTAAGIVRRGLIEQGCQVKKIPGYGRKREMMVGTIPVTPDSSSYESDRLPSWARAADVSPKAFTQSVAIIGAGLSGLLLAAELIKNGLQVTVYEKQNDFRNQLSLALYAALPNDSNAQSHLQLSALRYSAHFLSREQSFSEIPFWHATGLMQFAVSSEKSQKLEGLMELHQIEPELAAWIGKSELKIVQNPYGAVEWKNGGWLDLKRFQEYLVERYSIDVKVSHEVEEIINQNSHHRILFKDGTSRVHQAVVLANSHDVRRFLSSGVAPVQAIAGQVTHFEFSETHNISHVLCGEGYACPLDSMTVCAGSSYHLKSDSTVTSESDNQANAERLRQFLGNDSRFYAKEAYSGVRCASTDYMPIVGPVPDLKQFDIIFSELKHNAKAKIDRKGSYRNGMFVLSGFGSKGLLYAPLCASSLAAQICRKVDICTAEQKALLSPGRFAIRRLKRGRNAWVKET